ncbi:CDF family Co(II)/Ni(II) efflux transporter DmeF [soil metagenome]
MTLHASRSLAHSPRERTRPADFRRSATNERKAWIVAWLSFFVMTAEVAGGIFLNSVGLISDGIHTFTHVAVMVMAASAYIFARSRADDPRFAFGTGKTIDLAGFGSGVGLAVIALLIAVESVQRLIRPEPVGFAEAAAVATLGLAVGLISAMLLRDANHRGPDHLHLSGNAAASRDLNLWAAYLHMVADVLTSVLTIIALGIGAVVGWIWLDPVVGLLNAVVVATFAARLLHQASATLLDWAPSEMIDEARLLLEAQGGHPIDVKVWPVGDNWFAVSARVGAGEGSSAGKYRAALTNMAHVKYILIEIDG